MQAYKDGKLVQAIVAETRQELLDKVEKDVTHFVVGEIPGRGKVVEIDGLEYVVLSKSDRKGTLHLKIRQPRNQMVKGEDLNQR